ncbi:hypothetical protein DPMN_170416 [Dreissena polymorpha]|uniref:Uncharacterized protein n=1 Tax=Dreissena polymorpha TaxID=45954 RepID=A0A9D4DW52_DREPO|nr:hypothetical protein DPMN_170416 [Dreissena polymorpha]
MMQEMDHNVEVDIKYKVVEGKEAIDFTSAEEMRSRTMQDFKQGRKWVEFIFTLIKRVLGFTFLLVVMRAYKYYKRFKGKKVLLPLKKNRAHHPHHDLQSEATVI